MNPAPAKLRLDFPAKAGLSVRMDDDTTELIVRLCTRIGMIMEDASVIALTVAGMTPDERTATIEEIAKASQQIVSLTAALQALEG